MDDMANMTLKDFEQFYQNIEMIQAQELLISFQSSDYPQLKSDVRGKIYKQVRKTAYPNENKRISTQEEVERFFNG